MSLFEELSRFLSEPAFLAKVLDWGIVWGTALGVVFLLASMAILRERKAIVISLCLLGVSSLLILPAEYCREKRGPVDAERAVSMQRHEKMRDRQSWLFYTQGVVAILAALLGGDRTGAAKFLTTVSVVGGLIVVVVGLWLQLLELKIIYPALRHMTSP